MTHAPAPANQPNLATVPGRLANWASLASGLIPLALVMVAEAAWVTVLAGLVQEYSHHLVVNDLGVMAVFVVCGLVITRLFGRRVGERWPGIALALSVIAVAVGVLVSSEARSTLAERGLLAVDPAIAANPGGLLCGLALLRGISWGHAGLPLPEDRLLRLLGGGLVAITLTALAGNLVGDPWRAQFLSDALANGLIFGASAIVALALTRQQIAAGETAAWQRNPIWVASMLMLVATAAAIGLAASGHVRTAIELIVLSAAIPILIVGLLAGWTRRTFPIVFALLGGFAVIAAFGPVIERVMQGGGGGDTSGVGVGAAPEDPAIAAAVTAGLALMMVIVVLLLVRIWMRQFRIGPDNPIEERYVDRTPEVARRRRTFRLPFGQQPVDAVGAYRALVTDISERDGVRREAWETPLEHATRLRHDREGAFELDLLAADYALAAFGGVALTPAENRRAVGRWRTLRRRLRARPETLEN